MHRSYDVWTQERVEELTALWLRGDSAGVIGAAMAMSRNAILGKVFRLGLASRKSKIPFEAKPQRRVFVARSLKPPKPISRPFITLTSAITGGIVAAKRKTRTESELTKTELRAQLTLAVINTGGIK